jgi:hypothetical protein
MSGGGSLVAHEASAVATQKSNAILMSFTQVGSGIRASIKDSISGLHLDTAGQAAGNDIADGGRRFNRRNPDFPDEGTAAQHQHLGVRLDSLPAAKV